MTTTAGSAAPATLQAVALPHLMDPMYWIGPGGLFAAAVLPAILVIVFIETGLLFPILPGDSLLFTGGLLAAKGTLNIWVLIICVAVVAVLGDQTAYFIGRGIGPALFDKEDSRFFKKRYVTQTHEFFEKHGPKTIILARFVPIVRTFTPVLAGVSYMRYPVFLGFDIIGGIAWAGGVTLLGYFLGNVSFVRDHIELMILVIVVLSILPGIISVGRGLLERRRGTKDLDQVAPVDDPARIPLALSRCQSDAIRFAHEFDGVRCGGGRLRCDRAPCHRIHRAVEHTPASGPVGAH